MYNNTVLIIKIMKLLFTLGTKAPTQFVALKGPETNRDAPDPHEAVRSGLVGELADLEQDVVEEAAQDGSRRSMLQFLVDGPVVGPIRAWRRLRKENDSDE